MTKFERQIEEGRILSKLPSWQRLVQATRSEIAAFIAAHSSAMLSLSWGKQSTVLAHLLHEMRLRIACVFFREEQSHLVADFDALSHTFLAKWPINYVEESGDHHLKSRAAAYRAETGVRGTLLGLAAEESSSRRMTTAKGWLRWADGTWRCTPLRKWTWRDIAAYHAAHDLPCLAAYRRLGFETRTSAGLAGHAEKGLDAIAPSKARLYGSNDPSHLPRP